MKKLATIKQISKILPSLDDKHTEQALIDDKCVLIPKGEYIEGQLVIYMEQFAWLPDGSIPWIENRDGIYTHNCKKGRILAEGDILDTRKSYCPSCSDSNKNHIYHIFEIGDDVSYFFIPIEDINLITLTE